MYCKYDFLNNMLAEEKANDIVVYILFINFVLFALL